MGIKNDAGTVSAIPYAILALVIFGLSLVAFGAIVDELVAIDSGMRAPVVVTEPTNVPGVATAGPVVVWGAQNYGACDVPRGLIATRVGMGDDLGIAIQEDGSVAAWGDYEYDNCGVVPGYIRAKDLAVGNFHTLILKTDGTVYGAGDSSLAGCAPPGMEDTVFEQIATSNSYNVGLTLDGSVISWDTGSVFPMPDDPGTIKQVALDRYYGYPGFLLNDGSVFTLDDAFGIPEGMSAKKIVGGGHFIAILKTDGSVGVYYAGWDTDYYGVTLVPPGLTAKDIAAGENHVAVIRTDGSVVCWGDNSYGQCIVPDGIRAISITAGYDTTAVVAVPGTEPGPDWTPAPGEGGWEW